MSSKWVVQQWRQLRTSTRHLVQELLMNVQCSDGSRSFAKEMRALKMRSVVTGHRKLTTTESIIKVDPLKWVVVSFPWPVTELIFKALISFAKLPEPPLDCTFIRSSWAKCIVDVASNLYCL